MASRSKPAGNGNGKGKGAGAAKKTGAKTDPKEGSDPPEESSSGGENGGKVKKLAKPAPSAYMVELREGTSYAVRGKEFVKGRGVIVGDPALLAVVLKNSRFKCSPIFRKEPAKKKPANGGKK